MQFSVLASIYYKEIPVNLDLALLSVFNQSLTPNEVVLVKDGPLTNELEEIVSKYIKLYPSIIKIIPLEVNVGLGNALNHGLKYVSNEFVARMDTDDICYFNRFETQLNFLEAHPNISVVGGIIQEFNKEPGDLKQFRKLPLSYEELVRFSKFRNPLSHPSVMFRKSAVLAVGSYQDMPLFEDYFLWVRLLLNNYKIANIDQPLLHFRIGNDMIGRRSGVSYIKKEIHFLNTLKKYRFISNKDYYTSLGTKIPLRLLPKSILLFIYKTFLR